MKKILTVLLVAMMATSLVACGNKNDGNNDNGRTYQYTYQTYSTALATNWNPHTWEMNADQTILNYLTTPLVDISVKDSTTGEYQWVFDAATDVKDVTAEHQDDLTKYAVSLPAGVTSADEVTAEYVYEISLNPNLTWEDGTPINADSYVSSMKHLLDPSMKNYRANNYISGESALAGAYNYYYSGDETLTVTVAEAGYESNEAAQADGKVVMLDMWNFFGLEGATDADGNECPQYVDVTDEHIYIDPADNSEVSAAAIYEAYGPYLEVGGDYAEYVATTVANDAYGTSFDTVGLYKVDDYTIRYVCASAYSYYYFLTSCTGASWLVYEDLYESSKDTTGTLVTTKYNSSLDTTMSYGPYRMESLQDGKQMVLVQNEKWYGYEEQEDGSLLSMTDFEVDGESVQQYQTEKIVIDVMTDDAAKQAFLKGQLDEWTPSAEELVNYSTSEQLYQVDETYTMRFFFNCDFDNLKEMDASMGNTNSVVLSNETFRKAMSLALDRSEWVSSTPGYKPAYSLISSLYFYDVYEDPTSIYRNTDEAMQAIVNLYDVAYGEGTPYATLEDAYKSINGYNLTEAKALFTKACEELVAAGLYTEGADIVIRVGYKAGPLDSSDNQQITLFNKYLNAALEGSGFGKIELVAVDNLSNRYASVANGEFAMGYGAWGGAAFYPFTVLRVYCDPDYVDPIHESGCWDPSTETLTLTVNGVEDTMTWQKWSTSMTGNGKYADADNETKLSILAGMEENYLAKYYVIPLATTTACSMLSYKTSFYTDNYSIMYSFGGTRLQTFNYTDAEWSDYVSSQGGALNYE